MSLRLIWTAVGALVLTGAAEVSGQLAVPPGRWWDRPQVTHRLALTDEQRSQLDKVTVDHAKRMIDLKATVDKAELEVRVAAEAEPFDAATLRTAFSLLQQARVRLESERFELLVAQRELLTSQQWQKLRVMARDAMERRREGREPHDGSRPQRQPDGPRRF